MTATLLPPQVAAPSALPEPVQAPALPLEAELPAGPRRAQRWRCGVLVGAVVTLLAVEAVRIAPSLSGALASLAQTNPAWLVVAVLAAAGSMSMFARSRRRLLRAAGVQVPVRSAVAAVYVANALHTTLPGGAAFSTGYTYRWMRGWGASRPAATWTLAAGGVVASASLAGLGLLGSLLVGSGAGWVSLALGTAAVVGVALVVRCLQRSPSHALACGEWVLRRVNALLRRPPAAGLEALEELIAQLRSVRPSGCDWLMATAFATANWAFDAGCLAACAAAMGVSGLTLAVLLLAYAAGMAASSLSLLPGGVGVVDAALVFALVAGGIPAAAALPAVLLYRLISLGGVVAVGWVIAGVRGLAHPEPAAVISAPRGA
ncbi:MAG: lysylphosphatidylglycerol synthase transmembrane domain-containing protein [Blastococcus sp.]